MNIDILLGTYNGSRYLGELIDSVISQSYQNITLNIRDDLSQDNTTQVISHFYDKLPKKIKVIDSNQNIGIKKNYSKILKYAKSQYIFFCDQDDVWLPNKIQLTLNKIIELEEKYGKDTPLLVHTNLKVVDSHLYLISDSFWKYQNLNPNDGKSLSRLLIKNVVTGCTMAINSALKNMIDLIPDEAIMHDWWIALVAATFGKIEYIDTPTILYRQHSSNDTGATKWGTKYLLSKIVDSEKIKDYFSNTIIQAEKFLEIYKDILDEHKLKIIKDYINLKNMNCLTKKFTLINNGYYKPFSLSNFGLFLII